MVDLAGIGDDDEIVAGAVLHEIEAVLEAGAAAAGNRNAQGGSCRFAGDDCGDTARGAITEGHGLGCAHRFA